MWECEWWQLYKTDVSIKEHCGESFPYKRPLRQDQLLDRIESATLFGYSQCDIKVPEHLRETFANISPIFKNTNVCRQGIDPFLMQEYAEREGLRSQPRRMLISSFELTSGTIITPLLLFYWELGRVYTKIYRFVEYTPVKYFNKFVQSAVNARRQVDENPNSWFCRNYEVACKQLVWLSNYGSQSPFSYKVYE